VRERLTQGAGRGGFTLVELMIVVVIVALLALAAAATLKGQVQAARMSEGITGAGVIRTAMRIYRAAHSGVYPTLSNVDGNGLREILIVGDELEGKFFGPEDYTVSSSADSYTIRVTLSDDDSLWYEIDEEGNVSKSGSF